MLRDLQRGLFSSKSISVEQHLAVLVRQLAQLHRTAQRTDYRAQSTEHGAW